MPDSPFVIDALLNDACLEALDVSDGDRILDVGCGEGALARQMAERGARVVAFDVDGGALARARSADSARRVDWRSGDARNPPIQAGETFDLVLARFVLESTREPESLVRAMVAATAPGGRIALIDDDHDPLLIWPPCPELTALWAAYVEAFDETGDSRVGRKLAALLHGAGARPIHARNLSLGGCAGDPWFPALTERVLDVLETHATRVLARGYDRDRGERALATWRTWARRPDAAIWHQVRLAIGRVPGRRPEQIPRAAPTSRDENTDPES